MSPSPSSQATVILGPCGSVSVLELLKVAEEIKRRGKWNILFLVEPKHEEAAAVAIHKAGFIGILPSGKVVQEKIMKPEKNDFTVTAIRTRAGSFFPLILQQWLQYRKEIQKMDKLLKEKNVCAVVVESDRTIGWTTAIVASAKRRKIPSFIVPFALSDFVPVLRLLHKNFEKTYGSGTFLNRFTAKWFPNWTYMHEGKPILFQESTRMLAAWLNGMMPRNPWCLAGGDADRVLVESMREVRGFLAQGVPEEKVVLTGKPSVDNLASSFTPEACERTRKALNLKDTDRVLLCAVPQLAEHNILPWDQHWKEVDFLLSTFAKIPNTKLILSLHPKSDASLYIPHAEQFNAIIAQQRYYELLPVAHVFVASFSSTVEQALALSIPTIVVDFYGLGFTRYDDTPGIVTVRDKEKLLPALQEIFGSDQVYGERVKILEKHATDWAMIDGLSSSRVVDEMEKLVSASHA